MPARRSLLGKIRFDRDMRKHHPMLWWAIILDILCLGGITFVYLFGTVSQIGVMQHLTDYMTARQFGFLLLIAETALIWGFLRSQKVYRFALTAAANLMLVMAAFASWGVWTVWSGKNAACEAAFGNSDCRHVLSIGFAFTFACIFMAAQFRIQAYEPRTNPDSEALREQRDNDG